MQTFLPYREYTLSAMCLDPKRLGKQRVEARQILNILLSRTTSQAWRNHPAVKMWRGYENELKLYYNAIVKEWIERGYNNTMEFEIVPVSYKESKPIWLTDDFIRAHRSNLLRKMPEWYSSFDWNVPNDLPYIWPI